MKNANQSCEADPVSPESDRRESAGPVLLGPGEVLAGKYRIEGVVGRGGMGVVYSATNVQLDQRVAVKMLLASADDETVARFTREARTAARLQNEHVARVINLVVQHEGTPVWIGGTIPQASYAWVNGEPWSFAPWVKGAPGSPMGNRRCVSLHSMPPGFSLDDCGSKMPGLCERD